ncbi:MAG: hypothetical protein M1816_001245 [Peltula sp. TS41687]|nr:MAG: hypothetical protein M1816_001245 [Peltula sp. TS41687]
MASRTNSATAEPNRQQRETGPLDGLQAPRPRSKDSEAEEEVDELEDVRPSKQPRALFIPDNSEENLQRDPEAEADEQELHPSKDRLSKENLRIFDKMDASNSRPGRIKRTSSRRSTAASTEVTQDTAQSHLSSGTMAYYRYTHLAAATVFIHVVPPEKIQAAIDDTVHAEPSEERRKELKAISQELHNGCIKAVRAAAGEDDFIHLFHDALKVMSPDNLCLREKADWRAELKPKTQQSGLNLDFMDSIFLVGDQRQEVDDASAPPPAKRQQQSAVQSYISPGTSMTNTADSTPVNKPLELNTMPPPPLKEKVKKLLYFPIKTPRPDISIGTQLTSLISALSSQGLNNTRAKKFLLELQHNTIRRETGGPPEPMLISAPALRASDLVFPFAVVEGKAYSTGNKLFEAESQAAVSGACALKIQLCLDELANATTQNSDAMPTASNTTPPLFFSICTEGPIHELWVHWTHIEDGVRKFNMTLLESCNGVLLKGVENFIVVVDNVCRWGTGQFMESVAARLGKVARKARA